MKYLVAGTTEANLTEVIKSLESLWDAADQNDQPFEVCFLDSATTTETPTETLKRIEDWLVETDCLWGFESLPLEPDLVVLALAGEAPGVETAALIHDCLDQGLTVYDLASQMIRLEFDDEAPATGALTEVEQSLIQKDQAEALASLSGGWPGEAPESPVEDTTPENPVAPVEEPQAATEDPAVVLEGVTENDLERMSAPELRALCDRTGAQPKNRKEKGAMVAALMELIIALDKMDKGHTMSGNEVSAVLDAQTTKPIDTGLHYADHGVAGGFPHSPEECAGKAPTIKPEAEYYYSGPPVTAVIVESVYADGSSKKKVIHDPSLELLALL